MAKDVMDETQVQINRSDETVLVTPNSPYQKHFGKYEVKNCLGKGAMGVVYLCWDPTFERDVAVKALSTEILEQDNNGEFRQRFYNEMKAAGRINHPNVVNVYDAGEERGVPYFVMELVQGCELKQPFSDGRRFELNHALRIIKDILRGLEKIHSVGIVHRDLKPANIFLTDSGAAKIADFGVAKLDRSELTSAGTMIGSPRYMSPEQCQALPIDHRSDLFSAGIIFYQLLTSEHCFDANSQTALMQKIINSEPERPSVLIPTLNKRFDDIIAKALHKQPYLRFQSARDFIQAIDQALDESHQHEERRKAAHRWGLPVALSIMLSAGVVGSYLYSTGSSTLEGKNELNTAEVQKAITMMEGSPPSAGNAQQFERSTTESGSLTISQPSNLPGNSSNLDRETQIKIQKLLRVAKAHQIQGRYMAPSGGNAYELYQTILSINPDQTEALNGMQTLERLLIGRIQESMVQGRTEQAREEAKGAAALFPQSERLAVLASK